MDTQMDKGNLYSPPPPTSGDNQRKEKQKYMELGSSGS